MIFLIDEDEIQMAAFVLEMQLRGLVVKQFLSADEALEQQSQIGVSDYLIVDVMLATAPSGEQSQFTRDHTEGYKKTGLRLVEAIIAMRTDIPRNHFILISQASSRSIVDAINAFVKQWQVCFVPKSGHRSIRAFADAVQRLLA